MKSYPLFLDLCALSRPSFTLKLASSELYYVAVFEQTSNPNAFLNLESAKSCMKFRSDVSIFKYRILLFLYFFHEQCFADKGNYMSLPTVVILKRIQQNDRMVLEFICHSRCGGFTLIIFNSNVGQES